MGAMSDLGIDLVNNQENGATVTLISVTDPMKWDSPLDIIEYAGRVDYGDKSISKMGDRDIIRRWIDSGHESMLEMADATFMIECSRVVSHELVRHRLASFQQESQRYVRYDDLTEEDLFSYPDEVTLSDEALAIYHKAMKDSLRAYKELKALGLKSQIARYVLPNATRTRIVMKANLREWRHVLLLRMHSSAQPEMQEVARQIHAYLVRLYPEVFGDIAARVEAERQAR